MQVDAMAKGGNSRVVRCGLPGPRGVGVVAACFVMTGRPQPTPRLRVSTVAYWKRCGAPIVRRKKNDLAGISRWRADRDREGISVSTSNAYLTAIKSFCHWLVRDRRAAENPLVHLSALNAKTDVRRERRALSQEEFASLIQVAATSEKSFRGLCGKDRAILYLTAASTGLRAGELASLTEASFDFAADPPTVTVEAAYSKHRRRDMLPLRSDLAERIKAFIDTRKSRGTEGQAVVNRSHRQTKRVPAAKLWPGTWHDDAADMLRIDLDAADIPYVNASGHVFDFHALRHHFITSLAQCGVHPKHAQTLARHSTITLTMDRYSHVDMSEAYAALGKLPNLPHASSREELSSTQGENARHPVSPLFPSKGSKTGVEESPKVRPDEASGATKKNPGENAVSRGDSASAPCWTRTNNPLIKSQMLCQLS
jgi:integrase